VGLFLIGNSNQLFTRSFQVYADFSTITGIVKGGKVRVAGMDAGTVTSIDVPSRPEAKFRVHFRIVEKLHPIVRRDSVASIQTDGLLGNKYLQIDAGSSKEPLAQSDSMIRSTEPFDWGDLMTQISNAVRQVNGVLSGAKEQLHATLSQIEGASRSANLLIKEARPQVTSILASADKIGANLRELIDGVQQGEGTVGALFKDQEMQASVKRSVAKTEEVVDNLRQTTVSAKNIVDKAEESDIVPEVQRTVKNLQQITSRVKDAVDKFQAASGEGGVGENLQRTLADAHEAMSDLSDDTEALKHNFFFRGFFKKRGFYDLGALTTSEYKSPAFAKGFKKYRVWLDSVDIFGKAVDGTEMINVEGKHRLDEAMTQVLTFPRNGPLMIEGFTGVGARSQQYLQGRRRAALVEAYLVTRFHLRPAYVGLVSMGAVADAMDVGRFKEGVGIVSFYK
jgi:phospholipid/cholesterol/gamma-HCH transport system substrate-binding protein